MSNNICLATNYLFMTEPNRQMWVDLDRHLDEFGCRLMLFWLIGCNERVPTRRNLRDFAKFIADTSLDSSALPPMGDRWEATMAALEKFRVTKPAAKTSPFQLATA